MLLTLPDARPRRALCIVGSLLIVIATGCDRSHTKPTVRPSERATAEPDPPAPNQPAESPAAEDDQPAGPVTHALLVACTKYDFLPEASHLRGPVNDAALLRRLLIDKFQVDDHRIRELSEAAGAVDRPLHKNITRELQDLAGRAAAGDQVVILLSGHGSQQPADADDEDPEPDGMDEVFCPADVKASPFAAGTEIANGISDDQLSEHVDAIRDKGASVWLIVDACHSGTAVRGARTYRQLAPEQLLSSEALGSRAPASRTRGIGGPPDTFDTDDRGGLVALYAAQPHEPTFEAEMPGGAEDAKPFGVLTYTLVHVLAAADSSVTYEELTQRIHEAYLIMGVGSPTPLIEGADRDREVMGIKRWPERSRLTIGIDQSDRPRIAVGRLHGMTEGTVLAVYPPAGAPDPDELLGHVVVDRAGDTESNVAPVGFNGTPEPDLLPLGGRCEIVRFDYGLQRLRISYEDPSDGAPEADRWNVLLSRLAEQPGSVVEHVADPEDAQWLLRRDAATLVLVPAEGWTEAPGGAAQFGPVPEDDRAASWIEQRLQKIARARHLLQVAGTFQSKKTTGLFSSFFHSKGGLEIEMRRMRSPDDAEGELVKWRSGGLKLSAGDVVGLRISNNNREATDVSLLFVDSGFGIEPLFPSPDTVADNRIPGGESLVVGPLVVEGDSVGLEHLVVIGLKAAGTPVDFTWLAQDSLHRARGAGGEGLGMDTPLGELMRHALFADGQTRGMKMSAASDTTLAVISWHTVAADE